MFGVEVEVEDRVWVRGRGGKRGEEGGEKMCERWCYSVSWMNE